MSTAQGRRAPSGSPVSASNSAIWRTPIAAAPPPQAAGDVHQATHVGRDHGARPGGLDRVQLALEHRARNGAHLHGEQAAEAAAGLGVGQRPPIDVLDGIEQGDRLIAHAEPAQAMAARMVGHAFARTGAAGCLAKDVHEELRELVRALRQALRREDRSPGRRRAARARDAPACRRRIPTGTTTGASRLARTSTVDAPSCAHRPGIRR